MTTRTNSWFNHVFYANSVLSTGVYQRQNIANCTELTCSYSATYSNTTLHWSASSWQASRQHRLWQTAFSYQAPNIWNSLL